MGKALELVTGFVTFSNAAFVNLGMAAGNTLTIRNAPLDSDVRLLQAWMDVQFVGQLRIRSPRLHDNVHGIHLDTLVANETPLLPWGFPQKLIPQDTLIAELSAADAAGDIETACMLIYYANLAGIDARLASAADVIARMVNLVTVENTIALGAAGGYSGEEAINAEEDLLKANTDYALLGYLVDTQCTCVRWRGADTGNLGVGGPGDPALRHLTKDWFVRLSREFNLPLIPVFNSANRAGILIDGAQDENGADATVTSIFAEIGPSTGK
jgi:hypothetical protein